MMGRSFFIGFMCALIFIATGNCESFKYEPHGKRDPFVPLIGQDRIVAAGLADITSVEDVRLEGIAVRSDGGKTAIINGEIVKEGFKEGELVIKKIERKHVIILIGGKEFSINLPEEGGAKE